MCQRLARLIHERSVPLHAAQADAHFRDILIKLIGYVGEQASCFDVSSAATSSSIPTVCALIYAFGADIASSNRRRRT